MLVLFLVLKIHCKSVTFELLVDPCGNDKLAILHVCCHACLIETRTADDEDLGDPRIRREFYEGVLKLAEDK